MDVGYPVQGGSQITLTDVPAEAGGARAPMHLPGPVAHRLARSARRRAVLGLPRPARAERPGQAPPPGRADRGALRPAPGGQARPAPWHPGAGLSQQLRVLPADARKKNAAGSFAGEAVSRRAPSGSSRCAACARMLVNSEFLRDRLERRDKESKRLWFSIPSSTRSDFLLEPRTDARPPGYVTGICGYAAQGSGDLPGACAPLPDSAVPAGRSDGASPLRDGEGPAQRRASSHSAHRARSLRRSKVVLVPSQWAEPFGRIAVEAMASGIPTLASRTGGLAEIVGDSSLGVAAFRRVEAWQAQLGTLLDSAAARQPQRRSRDGRSRRGFSAMSRRSGWTRWCCELGARATACRRCPRRPSSRRGRADAQTAYARVNREWLGRLEPSAALRGCERAEPGRFLPAAAGRGGPPRLSRSRSSSCRGPGRRRAGRGAHLGLRPAAAGLGGARSTETAIGSGCTARWVKRQAIAAGVEPRKVRVVPLGVDERVFRPDGPHLPLPTERTFRFLFVGATVLPQGDRRAAASVRRSVRAARRRLPGDQGPARRCLLPRDRLPTRDRTAARDPADPELLYLREDLPVREHGGALPRLRRGRVPVSGGGFRAADPRNDGLRAPVDRAALRSEPGLLLPDDRVPGRR